jgi:hypothetical protein
VVFAYGTPDEVPNGSDWPYKGYDYDARKRQLFDVLRSACPEVELLPSSAHNAREAAKILESDRRSDPPIDGYMVYQLGLWTFGAQHTIVAAGRPTLLVDDLFGGTYGFLNAYAAACREGKPVAGVASSRMEDVVEAARCFKLLATPGKTAKDFVAACNELRRKHTPSSGDMTCKDDSIPQVDVPGCLEKLRSSTIIQIGGGLASDGEKAIQEIFSTKVVKPTFQELHELFVKADRDKAAEVADRWIAAAEKVVEPNRDEIIKSGTMYLAMKDLMDRYQAQAIAINCLEGHKTGGLKAYPCLGFSELNNGDQVGVCEGDLNSAITMLTMRHLINRPGYISDPVIDTSKNQVIYAHCVAPQKVFGPEGPVNPYRIRSHAEDNNGAAVQSMMPLGYMTTTIEFFLNRRELSIHQGKTVANIDIDKACRSKLAVDLKGDMEKLLRADWDRGGWHRVTFYGDVADPIREVCRQLKIPVVPEA